MGDVDRARAASREVALTIELLRRVEGQGASAMFAFAFLHLGIRSVQARAEPLKTALARFSTTPMRNSPRRPSRWHWPPCCRRAPGSGLAFRRVSSEAAW